MKYFLTLIAVALLSAGCSKDDGKSGGGTPANPPGNPPGPSAPKEAVPFEKAVVGAWLAGCDAENMSRDLLVVKDAGKGLRQQLYFDTAECAGDPVDVSDKENFTYTIGAEKNGARTVEVKNNQGTFPFEVTIKENQLTLTGLGQTALYQKVVSPDGLNPGDPLPPPAEVEAPPMPQLPSLPGLPPAQPPQPPPGGGDQSAAFNAAIKGTWETACAVVNDPQTGAQIGSQVGVLEIGEGKAVQWARLYVEVSNCSGEWSRLGILNFNYTVLSFAGGVADLDIRITAGVPNPQPQRARVSVYGNSMALNQAGAIQSYSKMR